MVGMYVAATPHNRRYMRHVRLPDWAPLNVEDVIQQLRIAWTNMM